MNAHRIPDDDPQAGRASGPDRMDAARVAWPRDRPTPSAPAVSRRDAVLPTLVGASVGAILVWQGHPGVGRVVWGVTGALLLLALVSPNGAYAAVRRALHTFGQWVGRGMAWLLLPPLYWLFFVPFGRLTRHGARDPMQRRVDPTAASYWQRRTTPGSTRESFERQF